MSAPDPVPYLVWKCETASACQCFAVSFYFLLDSRGFYLRRRGTGTTCGRIGDTVDNGSGLCCYLTRYLAQRIAELEKEAANEIITRAGNAPTLIDAQPC